MDQLRGQSIGIGKCLGNFRAAGLSILFFLFLFRLCCDGGIGVFYFEDGCVTGCFFGLVGLHINFAHDILLKQRLLTIFQSLDLFLIFRGFSGNRIQTDASVRTDGKDGIQLCFQRLENDLFQFLRIDSQIMARAAFICLRVAAIECGMMLSGNTRKCMVAAPTEHDAFQEIIPLLLMRLGKAVHGNRGQRWLECPKAGSER